MTDESLRALERAAAADPARTLEWTCALERAGRADEAWVALCRAVDQPGVRAELATRPAWTHEGGPGGARALDVPPVRSTPRVRWMARVGQRRLGYMHGGPVWLPALASPLGVASLAPSDITTHVVLDARDGRVVSSGPGQPAWLDGPRALCSRWQTGQLFVAPLGGCTPGEGALELPPPGGAFPTLQELAAWLPGDSLPTARPLALPADLVDLFGPDANTIAAGGAGRVVRWPAGRRNGSWVQCVVAPPHLLLSTIAPSAEEVLVALDLESLSVAWRLEASLWAADPDGLLVAMKDRLALLDPEGAPRWTSAAADVWAVGRDVVLIGSHLHDRRTGRPRDRAASIEVSSVTGQGRPCLVLVRDVLVHGREGEVVAESLDGETLWTYDAAAAVGAPDRPVVTLAPLPGALLVGVDGPGDQGVGHLLCLEESA